LGLKQEFPDEYYENRKCPQCPNCKKFNPDETERNENNIMKKCKDGYSWWSGKNQECNGFKKRKL
jgi:hypothetical protein